jgi:hypothetical protein
MPQYLLRASAEEFDSWRAVAGGKGALARWIRRTLNEAAGPPAFEDPGADAREPVEPMSSEVRTALREHGIELPSWQPSFRPDFKGGKR